MCTLYERIHELCKQADITGNRLCTEIGIRPSTLTDLKMGRQKTINITTATAIANYFGVTVDYLLGTEKPAEPESINIDALLENASLPELLEIMSKATERLNSIMGK